MKIAVPAKRWKILPIKIGNDKTENEPRKDPEKQTIYKFPLVIQLGGNQRRPQGSRGPTVFGETSNDAQRSRA